jgi:tetratricopeptide (TPR) repeat protein
MPSHRPVEALMFRRFLPALLVAVLLGACDTTDRETAELVEQARELMADEDYGAAIAAMTQVLQRDPQNVEVRLLMADLADRTGDADAMITQFEQVLAVDPDNVEAHVGLADALYRSYQRSQEPRLLERVREHSATLQSLAPDDEGAKVLQAALKREDGDIPSAFEGVRAVLTRAPDNAQAIRLLLAMQLDDGDFEGALATLDLGIAATSPPPSLPLVRLYMLKVNLLSQLQRWDAVEAVLQEVHERFPNQPRVALRLAAFYTARGQSDQAQRVLQATVDVAAESEDTVRARNELARLKVRAGDIEGARALIDAALAASPSNAEALLMRATLAVQEGDLEQGVDDLRTLLAEAPENEQALMLLAQTHLRAQAVNLAEVRLRQLVLAHPGNEFGRDRLAALLLERGLPGEAQQVLESSTAPPSIDSVQLLTEALTRQQQYDAALAAAQSLVEDAETARAGYVLMARVLQAQGRDEEALARLQQAGEVSSVDPGLLSAMLTSYVRLDRTEDALAPVTAWQQANPERFEGYTLLGQIYLQLSRLEQAEAAFEQSLSLNPDAWTTYRDLAGTRLARDDRDGALEVLEQGIAARPEDLQLRSLLAQYHLESSDFLAAIAEYEAMLAIDPSLILVANNVAALISDYDQSPERLRYALELAEPLRSSTDPVYLDTVGWVHYRLGDMREAVEYLERAVETAAGLEQMRNDMPQLRYHLGMAYLGMERSEEAKRELQAAVEDGAEQGFDGIEEARETLARL